MADLDLDAFAPPVRTLTWKGRAYRMPGALLVPQVVRLINAETRLSASYAERPLVDGGEVEPVDVTMEAALALVNELVLELQPDAQPLELTVQEMTVVFAWLISDQNRSVTESAAAAIVGDTNGHTDLAPSADQVEGGAPFEQTSPSSRSSSGSESTTRGGPSGGEPSPGPRSELTSVELTPA